MKPWKIDIDHTKIPPWMIPKREKYREVQIPLYLPQPMPPRPERDQPGKPVNDNDISYEV